MENKYKECVYQVIEMLKDIDIELDDQYITLAEIADVDELEECLQENGHFDVEIIYYYKAIEYLKENDSSLRDSLQLANKMGFTIDNLNSKLLASLLASENIRNEFNEIRNELESI